MLARVAPAEWSWHAACPLAGAMIKTLIVEDETQLRKNLANYLGSFEGEFEVLTASTAEEGSEILASFKVDILLTDVRLPGMSGIDLVRHAAAKYPLLKVVVMTAYASSRTRTQAMKEGALSFIEKPLDLAELRKLLLGIGAEERGWSGLVQGLDIFDFAQLMLWSRKSKAMRVRSQNKQGKLVFNKGQLVHASTPARQGDEAFYQIATWADGVFEDLSSEESKTLPSNVDVPLEYLLMESARRRDDERRQDSGRDFEEAIIENAEKESAKNPDTPTNAGGTARSTPSDSKKETNMGIPKDILNSLNGDVEGLQAAALFGSDGLPLLINNPAKADVDSFAAKFAMVSKLVTKTVAALSGGRTDEILVEQDKGWILVRPIGKADLNLIISVSPEATLGNLRLVAKKLVSDIAKAV